MSTLFSVKISPKTILLSLLLLFCTEVLAAQNFQITTVVSGSGKITSSTGKKTVPAGGSVTFYFSPGSAAYEISSVKIDNQTIPSKPSQITFSDVSGNHKLSVAFNKKRFQIVAAIQGEENGSLTPQGNFELTYGTSKTFKAKPKTGYLVQFYDNDVKVVEGKLNKTLSYTVKGINSHHNVQVSFTTPGGTGNRVPVAYDLSQTADPSLPYQQLQLSAMDPDHDVISFELVSPTTGRGYDFAYLKPNDGVLYMGLADGFKGAIPLTFRVSDGKNFSNVANVSLSVQPDSGNKGLGALEIDAKVYAGFDRSRLSATLLGAPGAAPKEPVSVDLSANFPTPGTQGNQSSCTAWATGYALKSYQEGIEEGWSLNTKSHLFSPAYIYNQINEGQDEGSRIYEALDLIINQGVATWATQPYSDKDYLTKPSKAAKAEAAKFKGLKRYTISNLSDVRGALAQHKPVVLGIKVYDQLNNLSGTSSVYNSSAGNYHGGHAVTVVGYDNNKFGGAVKIINSWGTSWGDKGFFWMPYDFFPTVTSQMYVLEDNKNDNVTPTPDPVPKPVIKDLPDLSIKSWAANLDYVVGGQGQLEYAVSNNGKATVPANVATVSFLISEDTQINANDTVVVYEKIPFELKVGGGAYRSFATKSHINFTIPPTLKPGQYYLGMMVDDLNRVSELNENNNTSLSNGAMNFTNNQADLEIDTWYAEWDDFDGDGALTYGVYNIGEKTAPAGWDVSLLLMSFTNSSKLYFLTKDFVPFNVLPGRGAFRNDANAKPFNIYYDIDDNEIPYGTYYMILAVDTDDVVVESDNEVNNYSFSHSLFYNNCGCNSASPKQSQALAKSAVPGQKHQAYNGRNLPDKTKLTTLAKVEITTAADGSKKMRMLSDNVIGKVQEGVVTDRRYSKTIKASDVTVFPVTSETEMPVVGKAQGIKP